MASSRLSLLSDEAVRAIAAFDITDLNDTRFGGTSFECPTCGMYKDQCTGHHASLHLGCSIFHPLIHKHAETIINNTCIKCQSKTLRVSKRCSCCGEPHYGRYAIKKPSYAAVRADRTSKLDPEEVSHILPCGYVISWVLIPPVYLRTPDDVEWSSDLQQLYEQLVQAVRRHRGRQSIAYIYAKIVGSTKKEGIMGLISGKDGIFRKIMLGKRVELCARAVITPDPYLDLDEVSVPITVAEEIRLSVRVTSRNIERLKLLAADNRLWWRNVNADAHPRQVLIGMQFDRPLKDGDLVLFNRQPSLSRESLMCFRAKIRTDRNSTFGMNPQVVSPFNADFDGDEMNILFYHNNGAEMLGLCHVSNNVTVDGKTVLIPVQDVVTGCYLMSSADVGVSKQLWHDCTLSSDGPMSTHGLLKACIPGYEGGVLRKADLVKIIGDIGGQDALDMIYMLQRVVERWLAREGLSVSLQHIVADPEPYTDGDDVDVFRENCHKRVNKNTQLFAMIDSGAKGSMMHASQMSVALGQQYVNGAKGVFCHNSYAKGLTPKEFFGHQMAGREGVVSTGVYTSFTGYLNRKTSKIIADVMENYNGTVGDEYCISSFTNYKPSSN